MDITVIVPCFNEGGNIEPLYQRLSAVMELHAASYEIIFIDDGSRDNSTEILEKISSRDNKVRVLRLLENSGKDAALYAGFQNAGKDIIVTIDGDLQNFPEDIPLLLHELGHAEAVIGLRKQRYDSFLKKASSCIANSLRSRMLKDELHDVGCGLRAFRKECLTAIGPYKLYDTFIMSILKNRAYKVAEVIVRHAPRKSGSSKFNIRNRVFRQTITLFVVWWLNKNTITEIRSKVLSKSS